MMKELFFFDYYLRVSIIFFCYSAENLFIMLIIVFDLHYKNS